MSRIKGLLVFVAFSAGFTAGVLFGLYSDVKDIIRDFYDDIKVFMKKT